MCRTPEPMATIARRLHAEKPTVPVRIVSKTNVLYSEIALLTLPLRLPGKMRFLELLPQPGDFNPIRSREENLEAHGLSAHRLIVRLIRIGLCHRSGQIGSSPCRH